MPNSSTPSQPARLPRISLRQVLAFVFVVAVATAGFGADNPLWSAAFTNINIALLLAAAISAIYGSARLRAFCIGFLLGDGILFLAEFLPGVGGTLLQHMLHWHLWNPDAPRALAGASYERVYVAA